MEYRPSDIEPKWQAHWREQSIYAAKFPSDKPKYYVLDMFPYPSGAGLHVGHPLGYIASDIVARYKRHKGFNVLHPMGFDAFGLPAEQYAIQTGQHPASTTEANIDRYIKQLNRIGFSFDWAGDMRTCEPDYYRWTQWIFLELFDSWYNLSSGKAEPISSLTDHLSTQGSEGLKAHVPDHIQPCSASQWAAFSPKESEAYLQQFRLAYRSESTVNWCPKLGTVLANDEVVNGLSERGGFPVMQKPMLQWSLRISAYAQRLLDGLEGLDWSHSIKETQRHWIGRSEGASMGFDIEGHPQQLAIFTTRPDTLFGVSFMVLAPEHSLVKSLTTAAERSAVDAYIDQASKRSERERMMDNKSVSGAFTGAYAIHPFTKEKLPIWISDYVLASYGSGAIMAVPAHDERDHAFASFFKLPIRQVIDPDRSIMVESDFLNGLTVEDAIKASIDRIAKDQRGDRKVQYRLRDAVFGRQRYWGEPIPVVYRDGVPEALSTEELPLVLPAVDAYLPTESGEPPLARASDWTSAEGLPIETSTMPGWAASSWYFLRYMDPNNDKTFAAKEAMDYWGQVDLYVGGSEHATGHLLYARFFGHFLNDRQHIPFPEPFKHMVNQGMIQGISGFVHREEGSNIYLSKALAKGRKTQKIHVDISLLDKHDAIDLDRFRAWLPDHADVVFEPANGPIIVEREVEKMSKSKYNVVNPDHIIDEHGADALRLFEMFLGPIQQSKPWDTKGLSGVTSFLRKVMRLMDRVEDIEGSKDEQRVLHVLMDKVERDIESLSLNTSVSAMMIAVNQWSEMPKLSKASMKDFAIILSPFAPHVAEEIWQLLDGSESITLVPYPKLNKAMLVNDEITYPVQFNGKTRFMLTVAASADKAAIEAMVMADERSVKYVADKTVRKVIVVSQRIVNVVLS